jgi:SAM-dependent methyltransferase
MGYAFGDNDLAAARLELVAAAFSEPSRLFLRTLAGSPIGSAVDLGCGPGFTTSLVASELRPARIAGIDRSEAFLEKARALCPDATWHHHDVTSVPLPTGPADLLYARLLLAHLPDPESVLASWFTQLRHGGHLLIEEDEAIVAEHPVLTAYEEMAASLVAHRGGDLYVGRRLARLGPPEGFDEVLNRLFMHRVPVPNAARMFGLNFDTWRRDPWISKRHSGRALDTMAESLERLAGSQDYGVVTFAIRQLAYRRQGAPIKERAS